MRIQIHFQCRSLIFSQQQEHTVLHIILKVILDTSLVTQSETKTANDSNRPNDDILELDFSNDSLTYSQTFDLQDE